jgi:DNA-binding response OmpR family regulator
VTKLLIVDDEEFTVDMLQTFLQINGYETIGAFNGEDGLVLAQVERPEMVILDLMLPDLEGYEVCRRLRTFPDGANIPVIVLSARTESASKERALSAGANAYLTKPVQFPNLLAELNRLKSMPAAPVQPKVEPEIQPSSTPPAKTETPPEIQPSSQTGIQPSSTPPTQPETPLDIQPSSSAVPITPSSTTPSSSTPPSAKPDTSPNGSSGLKS